MQEEIIMKKKSKHKKQQSVTPPISVSERIKNLMRVVSNSGEFPKLKFDVASRNLSISEDTEDAKCRIDKKDAHII